MPETTSIVGTMLLIFTGLVSYKGFRDTKFFEDYLFEVDKILIDKEYKRLITSSFLHANWLHFGLNMAALLSFSFFLELVYGEMNLLLLYFASMVGGDLLALYIHRNHGDYRAVGASGAISGVIFSSVVLDPGGEISFMFLPGIKSWIFGLLFIIISIFGIKKQADNIGHEAHLGGAITGVLLTPLIAPASIQIQWWVVAAILVPTIAFLILIVRNPAVLMLDNYWGENVHAIKNMRLKKSEPSKSKEQEINDLLDKIRKNGVESLSKQEKARLDELTKKL